MVSRSAFSASCTESANDFSARTLLMSATPVVVVETALAIRTDVAAIYSAINAFAQSGCIQKAGLELQRLLLSIMLRGINSSALPGRSQRMHKISGGFSCVIYDVTRWPGNAGIEKVECQLRSPPCMSSTSNSCLPHAFVIRGRGLPQSKGHATRFLEASYGAD